MTEFAEFLVNEVEGGPLHINNDYDCQTCWDFYPKPCKCGGLVHADFGDENSDCEYWLYKKCDKCGSDFEELNND